MSVLNLREPWALMLPAQDWLN